MHKHTHFRYNPKQTVTLLAVTLNLISTYKHPYLLWSWVGGWVEGGRIQSREGRENRTKERLRPHFLGESTLNVNHGEAWGVKRSPKD